jgi:hypothetical protein
MADAGERSGRTQARRASQRQPGWVLLVGVLGAACLVIGLIMLPVLRAPAVQSRVIVTSLAFIAAGIILLPVAWIKRVRKRPNSSRDQNAIDADECGRV